MVLVGLPCWDVVSKKVRKVELNGEDETKGHVQCMKVQHDVDSSNSWKQQYHVGKRCV